MKTLQVLVDTHSWLLGETLDLLVTGHVDQPHVHKHNCTKIKHIQFFVECSVILVHRKYSSEKRTPREIRTSFFYNMSPGLTALHHSELYSHIITVMIH